MGQKGINFIDKEPLSVSEQDSVDFDTSCQGLLKLKTLGETYGGTSSENYCLTI